MAFNKDNKYFYVANSDKNIISIINSSTFEIEKNITVGENLSSILFNPIHNLLYVTNFADDTVSVINSTGNSIVKTIQVVGSLHLGLEPNYLYYDTINNLLYVGIANTISIIYGISNEVIASNIIVGTPSTTIVGEYDGQIYSINLIFIMYL